MDIDIDIPNTDGIICGNDEVVKYESLLDKKGVKHNKQPFTSYKKNRNMTLISFIKNSHETTRTSEVHLPETGRCSSEISHHKAFKQHSHRL